jgi:hypothetical protein
MSGSAERVRLVAWCEACRKMQEDVQRVLVAPGALPPRWGTHACTSCRKTRGLMAAPRVHRGRP